MTNTPMTKEAFESWWGSSKYTQVIYHKDSNHQIAKDAWEASEANQQAEMDALKYDLDGYMKIAHASATEIVQQAQAISELVEALDEAILGLSNGLWDYGPGQDEHEQCDILLEKLRAISDKVKGK